MDTLPKLLYLFQTIPIMVSKSFFIVLYLYLFWKHGLSRVKYKLLTLLKLQGGSDLPEFELCYKATVMRRILEWFPHLGLQYS